MPGVDGFDVFYGGFRGVTIRAAVLLPYLLSCLMDRKYTGVILCILAEALHSLDPVWRGSLPACYCGMADTWSVGFPVPETMGKTEND